MITIPQLREALEDFDERDTIRVNVTDQGVVKYTQVIELVHNATDDKYSSPTLFVCPECQGARAVLYPYDGGLACARCSGRVL